jgi:hypothetical protein
MFLCSRAVGGDAGLALESIDTGAWPLEDANNAHNFLAVGGNELMMAGVAPYARGSGCSIPSPLPPIAFAVSK